jgi:hypothetical protein
VVLHPEGDARKVARGKRSAAPGLPNKSLRALEGAEGNFITQRWARVGAGVPSGREFFCLRFQGLRFACPWLPSCIPFGMQTSSYVAL